jgi:branched-chain amino acid transport system substrate-binding protein
MTRIGGRRTGLYGVALVTLALSACAGGSDVLSPSSRPTPALIADAPPPANPSQRIGTGSIKVALIVPLTGQGAAVGAALRNAAELAYDDFQKPDLQILVKDDRGTPDGAREAAQSALADGAEIVLGPLFAANVQSAGAVARGAGKPVVAFSTDAGVAARGVYLISFLPQSEVDRIVEEATAAGRRSFAALIPESTYGNAVEAQFREAVARRGARLVAIERYPTGAPGPAVERLRTVMVGSAAPADALFVPDTPDGLLAVAPALTKIGFSPTRVRPMGLALWNDPRVLSQPAFQYGTQRFADATLTSPAGFSGLEGTFRFRPDGLSERTLAVYEIRNNAAAVVSPAPKVLGPSGI